MLLEIDLPKRKPTPDLTTLLNEVRVWLVQVETLAEQTRQAAPTSGSSSSS